MDGASATLDLTASTDTNPGKGGGVQQEYTEAGPHDLNSGAVLKFEEYQYDLWFKLSAHTAPITVEAYVPP